MANLKEVRNRITSVNSTQQITKAMKMVSAAKLRRAQDAITQLRPYASKLDEILSNVSATLEGATDNKYGIAREEVKRAIIVVVTSDRGLCGGFNSSINKATVKHIEDNYSDLKAKGGLELVCVGKKGAEFFTRHGYKVNNDFIGLFGDLTFDNVKEAAEYAMTSFENEKVDKVDIVYNEFKNAAVQIVRTNQFLPIPEIESEEEVTSTASADYIFEPSKEYIVEELIPKSLKIQFYKSLLDSHASEHGARMTAMDKATDNAGEMLKDLKLMYNRSRQAAITTEILEIVGGAEALAAGK